MRRVDERLQDILDAIDAIERYAEQGKTAFETDELIQVWIIYHCGIIGEAVNALPANLLEQFPQIPWAKIRGMRNKLIHEYFGTDTEIIWFVTQNNLPELKTVISTMLD